MIAGLGAIRKEQVLTDFSHLSTKHFVEGSQKNTSDPRRFLPSFF
jgi:hypothetical protein